MFRRQLGALSLVAALLTGAAAAEEVRIAHGAAGFGLIQLFTAKAGGYFDDEGLDVEFVRTGSASKTVAALVGGAADMTVTSTAVSLNAQNQGIDLVAFGALITGYHTPIIFTKEWAEKHQINADSPIAERLAAMRGARLATAGPGGGDEIIRFYALKAGLDPDRDLTISHLGSDVNVYLAAVEAGQIDGFAVGAPASFVATREKGGIFALNPPQGEFPEIEPFLYVSAMGLRPWIEQHPEVIAKLGRAFEKALAVIQDPVGGIAVRDKVHAEFFPKISDEIFALAWENANRTSARSFRIAPGEIEKVAAFARLFALIELDDAEVQRTVFKN